MDGSTTKFQIKKQKCGLIVHIIWGWHFQGKEISDSNIRGVVVRGKKRWMIMESMYRAQTLLKVRLVMNGRYWIWYLEWRTNRKLKMWGNKKWNI